MAALACAGLAATAAGQMQSKQLPGGICKTTGGGRFVKIPGFKGEKIDVRLLPDVEYLVDKYKLFITDGYSMDPVHSAQGEHPLGLAIDVVPDKARGGTWNDIDALAALVEPKQNKPIAPFRWVGYDGDAGHGRGNHLHISWGHSEGTPGKPVKTVYTMNCPDGTGTTVPAEPAPPSGGIPGDAEDGGGLSAHSFLPKTAAPRVSDDY